MWALGLADIVSRDVEDLKIVISIVVYLCLENSQRAWSIWVLKDGRLDILFIVLLRLLCDILTLTFLDRLDNHLNVEVTITFLLGDLTLRYV